MTMLSWISTTLLLAAVFAASTPALAQDGYAGGWRIEKSEPAPWAHSADLFDVPEIKRLMGATVEFKRDRIVGPTPLACKGPHYEIKQYAADEVFQGELGETAGASNTADNQADKIGFGKRPIPSIVTGCASEIEFHALDPDHLIFALNNTLYRMARVKPAPAKAKSKSSTP
jgi:hypothetical protein